MSTALLASVARPAARSTASKLVDSSIRHTGAAFSLCTRGQHLSHPASPFSLPPFSLYHHQLHAAHGRRAVPLQSPTFSPSCRRGFSQSSKAELDLKVKAYVSTNKTTKPINIGNSISFTPTPPPHPTHLPSLPFPTIHQPHPLTPSPFCPPPPPSPPSSQA